MILKSLSRKSNTRQLLTYIFRYMLDEDKNTQKDLAKSHESQLIIKHNVRSRSMAGYIREFEENERYRLVHRKDSVKLYHTILSFSNLDKEQVNQKVLKDITSKFIELRGTDNLYIGTSHLDKQHIHVHLAMSGVSTSGKSSRISKQQLQHLKIALDTYQKEKYQNLAHSLPNHGKSKVKTPESILRSIKNDRLSIKEQLIAYLDKAYNSANSLDDFLRQLQQQGLQPYYRNDKLQGIKFEGETKFRFSRFGYTEEKLQTLELQKEELKALTELEELRTNEKRTPLAKEKPQEKKSEERLQNPDDKLLQELAALRGETPQRELEVPATPTQRTIFDELELLSQLREKDSIELER